MIKKELKFPQKDTADNIHEYGRDVAKVITLGLANPLVDFILPSFHQKRFDEWCQDVSELLTELQEMKLSKVDLLEDDEFISLLKESMIIASKTHQEKKHQLLKNALKNGVKKDFSFDEKLLYTRLVDTLSIPHLFYLKTLITKEDGIKEIKSFRKILEILDKDDDFKKVPVEAQKYLLKDLERSNLIELSEDIEYEQEVRQGFVLSAGGANANLPYIKITEFARKFMNYIMN